MISRSCAAPANEIEPKKGENLVTRNHLNHQPTSRPSHTHTHTHTYQLSESPSVRNRLDVH
jgi:hypothetical protein